MKHSSTQRIFGGLAALVAIMIAVGTAQAGSPWYWDGSVNEWNADYSSADPLFNHWLVEFGGAMNANLPNGQFNSAGGSEIYVNAGKVLFSSATYLGFSGQMKSQINVSAGEVEWNAGFFNAESGANITGTGVLTVNGGTFGDSNGGYGNVTVDSGGKAYFKGGTVSSVSPIVGVGGEVFVQGSNVTQTWSLWNNGGGVDPATILMNVESGEIAGISTQQGTVYQTGGTVTGDVTVGRREHWYSIAAYYNFGDEQGNTGTISGGTIIVGGKSNWGNAGSTNKTMDAHFKGYGTVAATTVDNNRSVIADGYGVDRTLDFSGVTNVTNTYMGHDDLAGHDTPTDGWYAVNGGKLVLPPVTVAAGTNSHNWGESADDLQIDLINSVNLAFSGIGAGGGGELSVALLAADRTDLGKNAFNPDMLALYDFDTSGGFDFGGGSVVLTFRYDNVLANSLGLTEQDLNIWHRTDTAWVNVTGSVDTVNYLITTTELDSFSMFAAAVDSPIFIPEPTSLVLLGLAGLTLLKRRHRK